MWAGIWWQGEEGGWDYAGQHGWVWEEVFLGVQDASLASGEVGCFCLRCGLGYSNKERRSGWELY